MQLRLAPVNLYEPLQAAIEVCREDLRGKQLELVTRFHAKQTVLTGDAVRLQQVFWNLIRNAVKFTPNGGVIRIKTGNVAGRIFVEISDTGIGIDPKRLSSIFEAFEQGEPDIQTRFGGSGLGLAICQALVDAHEGVIVAASKGKGHGAAFTVALPVANVPAGDSPGNSDRAGSDSTAPSLITRRDAVS